MSDILKIAQQRREELLRESKRVAKFLSFADGLAERAESLPILMERAPEPMAVHEPQPVMVQAETAPRPAAAAAPEIAPEAPVARKWYHRVAGVFATF